LTGGFLFDISTSIPGPVLDKDLGLAGGGARGGKEEEEEEEEGRSGGEGRGWRRSIVKK